MVDENPTDLVFASQAIVPIEVKAGGRDLVYIDSEIGLTAEVPVAAEPLAERR